MNNYHISAERLIFRICVSISVITLVLYPIMHSESVSGSSGAVFLSDEKPFGLTYSDWSEKFWIWQSETFLDAEGDWLGVEENGCFIRDEGDLVMLIDPSYGDLNQRCTISATQGILIDLWSGECDAAMKGYENASFNKILGCARDFNLGDIKATIKVDGNVVSELKAEDYTTNILNNAVEANTTDDMYLTLERGTRIPTDENKLGGTYLAAAHGWYAILKPLDPGNHTIYYQNEVGPSTLNAGGNLNLAHITYHLDVR